MKSWACSASQRNESALPHVGWSPPLSALVAMRDSLPGLSARFAPALTPVLAPRSWPLDGEFARPQVRGDDLGVLEHGGGVAAGDHAPEVEAHELVGDRGHEGNVVLDDG